MTGPIPGTRSCLWVGVVSTKKQLKEIMSSVSTSKSTNKMSSFNKFKTIHEYHYDCLKYMFRLHYKTWCIIRKERNQYWTLHLSDSVIHELRVHLSWVVIKDSGVFHLTKLEIGIKILMIFKNRKILRKLLKIIRKDENIMNIYMEWELL